LADKHPFAVAQLTLQYRMNEDICFLSNEIIYNGSLKCANEAIKSTKLCLPHFPKALKAMRISTKTVGFGWLVPVLNPKKSVVFACTDASGVINGVFKGLEVVQTGIDGGSIINETEAIVTQKILHGLSLCGLDYSSIAIICPYKSQVRLLNFLLLFVHTFHSCVSYR
jgi:DNA replication ATP-dependent helicase Dna2